MNRDRGRGEKTVKGTPVREIQPIVHEPTEGRGHLPAFLLSRTPMVLKDSTEKGEGNVCSICFMCNLYFLCFIKRTRLQLQASE